MNTRLKRWGWGGVVLCGWLCFSGGLRAQELSFLGGVGTRDEGKPFGGTWQVDYRQDFARHWAASIAYINEGHVPGHHRDGNAAQLWVRWPLFNERIALEAGAGADYYYDTQRGAGGGSVDEHGVAPIYSVSATGYFSPRVFYRVLVNRVDPAHGLALTTATVGVGVWLGEGRRPRGAKPDWVSAEKAEEATPNELTIFGGQSVVNTFLSPSARAWAAEYRRGLSPHFDATAGFVYEGDPEITRRSGLTLQGWVVNHFFQDRLNVGVGLGPYVYIDRKHPRAGGAANPAAISPLVSVTMGVRVTGPWLVRLTWDRVVTTYNRDADVFLAGIGYQWGR
ncbi:hypothetical protein K0B96_14225 [Horticoccus luteus]|uniref:Uncharacterized protein n=1 Tax=Horticoccus luteus TaxID=2862869 RepID=A0A8F9TUW7_9BACT|nr:hypothetical protein [Horticoccus luteus]QYM78441.1 hypothetical protein K0B96_14225 [Horticoccus luteus]